MGKLSAFARNLALVAISVGLSALALEGGLRLFKPAFLVAKLPNSPKLDSVMKTDEFSIRIRTNSLGLRMDGEIGDKRAERPRLVAVGDSFTFGWGVEAHEAWPARLETRLAEQGRPVELINLGKPGADLVEYLRLLHTNAMPLRPDLVLLEFLPGSDCPLEVPARPWTESEVERLVAKIDGRQRQASRPEGWWLGRMVTNGLVRPLGNRLKKGPRDAFGGSVNALDDAGFVKRLENPVLRARFDRLQAAGWVEKGRAWRINPWLIRHAVEQPDDSLKALMIPENGNEAVLDSAWRLCEGLLDKAAQAAKEQKVRLAIIILPSEYQIDPGVIAFRREMGFSVSQEMLEDRRTNDRLLAYCRRTGVPCIDTLDAARVEARRGGRLFHVQDGHMTVLGNDIVAQAAAGSLAALLAGK